MTAAAAQKLKNFLVHRRRRLEKQSFFLPIGGGGAIFSLKIGGGGGSAARLTPLVSTSFGRLYKISGFHYKPRTRTVLGSFCLRFSRDIYTWLESASNSEQIGSYSVPQKLLHNQVQMTSLSSLTKILEQRSNALRGRP
jgi:hypothetical protein